MCDTENPRVSVIIPTHGRREFLSEAVRSVLNQTYESIELIIVDDASQTPVEEELSEFHFDELSSMKFLRHEKNRGANAARNTGVKSASGDYIAFLDDDDRWEATKISKQVQAFEDANREVGVVYTWLRIERPGRVTIHNPTWNGDVLKELIAGKTLGQFSSIMVDRSIIQKVGLTDERFPIWQDRELFFRLAQECEFEVVAEPLTIRQKGHDDQISQQFEKQRDIAYPLFVSKHASVAAEYGFLYRRLFVASLRMSLGKTALTCNRYKNARKWFLLSIVAYPFRRDSYLYLLSTAGGERTYNVARSLKDSAAKLWNSVSSLFDISA